ncbi:hypothetical protein TNCV_1139301 [Trichonephila clavipes]|nr:hypothetical protein TNCV_1139301 [Trichonephila clavipes]
MYKGGAIKIVTEKGGASIESLRSTDVTTVQPTGSSYIKETTGGILMQGLLRTSYANGKSHNITVTQNPDNERLWLGGAKYSSHPPHDAYLMGISFQRGQKTLVGLKSLGKKSTNQKGEK